MLRILGVSVRLGDKMALDEVALQARAGELVVVEGGRGAGKTTLLQVAATMRFPDAGEVWVAGRDVTALQRASLPYVRRNVGYFAAGLPLLSGMTVLENVMLALGARGADPARARELGMRALGRVGVLGAATRRIETLSTAEVRLGGIARALAGARRVRLEAGHVLAGGGPIGVVASRRPDGADASVVRVEAHR